MEQKAAATEAAGKGASLPLNIGEAAKSRYEYMDESDIAFDVLTGLQNAVRSFRYNYDTDKLVKALAFYLVNSDDPKGECLVTLRDISCLQKTVLGRGAVMQPLPFFRAFGLNERTKSDLKA